MAGKPLQGNSTAELVVTQTSATTDLQSHYMAFFCDAYHLDSKLTKWVRDNLLIPNFKSCSTVSGHTGLRYCVYAGSSKILFLYNYNGTVYPVGLMTENEYQSGVNFEDLLSNFKRTIRELVES